jgi:hypothetical protein
LTNLDEQSTVSGGIGPEAPDTEYQYVVNVRAIETFVNTMSREGLALPQQSAISFRSRRLLNMRKLKERGILWSYSIIRVRTVEDVLEEG